MAEPLGATEKYWIAQEAQLVVVGTLQPTIGYPWFDGWRETGMISVDEVLYGQRPADRIRFRFTNTCYLHWWQRWLPSRFMEQFTERGLWFLRAADEEVWEPANGCGSGYRALSERADFERYIRLYKH